MKLKKIEIALLFAVAAALLFSSVLARGQEELADKLIRLHIVPNSDSADDQALKLRVRDAALGVLENALDGAASREESFRAVGENLNLVAAAAEREIAAAGYAYTVTAALTRESFPTRVYDDITLPAGEYDTLRIEIGVGAGSNWWCVIYPPLCVGAATEERAEERLEDSELSGGDIRLIADTGTRGTAFRFRALEFISRARSWFGRK